MRETHIPCFGPHFPTQLNRVIMLRSLQAKPMFQGGCLPHDATRRAKRLKVQRRNAARLESRAKEVTTETV